MSSPAAERTKIDTPSTGSSSSRSRVSLVSFRLPRRTSTVSSGSCAPAGATPPNSSDATTRARAPKATSRERIGARTIGGAYDTLTFRRGCDCRLRAIGTNCAGPGSVDSQGSQHLVERRDHARVEGAELRVQSRGLVVAHRVDDLLEVVGKHAEERQAPLQVYDRTEKP